MQNIKSSLSLKLFVIGFLIAILMIPIGMIAFLTNDRESHQDEAFREVSGKWGNEQTIMGPILSIPYKDKVERTIGEGTVIDETIRYAHFLPEALDIKGKIDRGDLLQSLVLSKERGGVEVPEKDARHMVAVASRMIEHSDDIRRYRARKDNNNIFFNQHKLAERLTEHLTHTYRIKLDKERTANLVEIIADRVTGVIEESDLNERLMKGVRSGGLALSEGEADDLTRYFEKVIAQGVDVSYKN